MSEQKYSYLEYHGRCIFNAVYDSEPKEEKDKIHELVTELLQIFQTGVLSIVREDGEIPNIETLVVGVRTSIFQGIFAEATQLSENQKHIIKGSDNTFPIRAAVNISREKIESILSAFAAKGSDAAIAYVKRLHKESSNKTSAFKNQAEEAIKKYKISEEARKKSNIRLSEATRKFQANRHMLIEQQSQLETERAGLIIQRNELNTEIKKMTRETNLIIRGKKELENHLAEKITELETANQKITIIEQDLERGKKARESLGRIDQKLQSIAKDGNTGPERLRSVFTELEELRKQQERFRVQQAGFSEIVQKYENSKAMNEALIFELQEERKHTKEARLDSLLDQNNNLDEHVLEGYYHAIEIYFILSLREFPKIVKNDTDLKESHTKVHALFSTLQTRGFNPLELGKKRLAAIKDSLKKRHDLSHYNIAGFTIEGIYREVLLFLEGIGKSEKNTFAIHSYQKMHREAEEIVR